MSATTWLIIAIVGFSLSGIALAVAVFMFIKMNIPAVIGDLSGKTVAREIKAMRDANASSGNKLHRSSSVNVNRGKLTEKVNDDEVDSAVRAAAHASKRLDRTGTGHSTRLKKGETGQTSGTISKSRTTESLSTNVGEVDIEERRSTAVLSQNRVTDVLVEERRTDVLNESPGTAVLSESPGTAVLSETRQTEILSPSRQTEVLADNMAFEGRTGTTLLSEIEELVEEGVTPVAFKVTKSVIKIHTDEVI